MICPIETFPALDALPFLRAAFLQRCPGVDVATDRETALRRLAQIHMQAMEGCGFAGMPLILAEQVHGVQIARVSAATSTPVPDSDGLATSQQGLCLGIYVADCAAVYLVDTKARAIALVHSGRKGTELGIVPSAIQQMHRDFGCEPEDLIVQIGPCIRPPHYEVDFAATIRDQARAAGVSEVHDCGTCTASDPERYYSYRREKGRTGRLLALLALLNPDSRV